MKALLVAFVATSFSLGLCANCRPELPPEPPIVVVDVDGGVFSEPFDDVSSGGYANVRCARGCANLQARHCPDGFTRPGEDSCYVVCRHAEETGKIDFHLDCIIAATSQDAIRRCGSYRCL